MPCIYTHIFLQVARDGNPPALLQNSEFIANKQSVNKETNFLKIVPGSVVSIPMWPPFQPEKFYTTIDKENNPDLVVNSSKRDLNIKQQQQQVFLILLFILMTLSSSCLIHFLSTEASILSPTSL